MKCFIPYGKDIYEHQRIDVKTVRNGYHVRWYYNGWHYWYFLSGGQTYTTEGQKYRTSVRTGISVSSGQVTWEQIQGLKTIMLSKEVYLYNDGWGSVLVEPGSNIVKKSYMKGYEIVLILILGACGGVEKEYTPGLPHVPAEMFAVSNNRLFFLGDEYGQDSFQSVNVYSPSKTFTVQKLNLDWAVVLNLVGRLVIYPISQNTSSDRLGYVILSLTGFGDVYIEVTQYVGTVQVFEANKTELAFIWDYHGIGVANYINFIVAPNKEITQVNTIPWATISINQITNIVTVYPNSKNDGLERSGKITFSVDGASDIEVDVKQFGIPEPEAPVAISASNIQINSFRANWNYSYVAEKYYIDVSRYADFSSFVLQNYDVGGVLSLVVTGLDAETNYYYRVRAYNVSGTSSNSNTISVRTADAVFEVSENFVSFDFIGNPCSANVVTVISPASWVASWAFGESDKFNISRLSGISGQSFTVTCVGENMEGTPYYAVLRVTSSGKSKDITITQYKIGMSCSS